MRLFFAFLLLLFAAVAASSSFTEEFDEGWEKRWSTATDSKYKGLFVVDAFAPDVALKIPEKAKHYGLTAALEAPLDVSEGVVVQFEARYSTGQSCSGAYMKFYSHDSDFKLEEMQEDTPYTIMFGPDVCGSTSKVHLILRHKSPKTGKIEEKHLKSPPRVKTDKKTHVYTAAFNPDNTFELMVDGTVADEGSLFEKFTPPINPPEEIPDPDDKKPEDWVDEAKIDDPDAVKPENWVDEEFIDDPDATKPEGWLDDEPVEIPDPDAKQPEDWDEEEDGAWVAPTVKNPACIKAPGCGEWKRPQKKNPEFSGPWKPPKIDNPAYKGEWKQKMIENPDYFDDKTPLKSLASIGALGFELWTMDDGIFFDNIVVTQDKTLAASYREKWSARSAIEKEEEDKKREKEKEEAQKTKPPSTLRRLLEIPALEPIAPYLDPVVTFCDSQGSAFYSFLAIVASLIMMTVVRRCLRPRRKTDEAAQRKKTDAPVPDDPSEEQEQTKEGSSSAGDPNPKDRSEGEERDTTAPPKSRRSN